MKAPASSLLFLLPPQQALKHTLFPATHSSIGIPVYAGQVRQKLALFLCLCLGTTIIYIDILPGWAGCWLGFVSRHFAWTPREACCCSEMLLWLMHLVIATMVDSSYQRMIRCASLPRALPAVTASTHCPLFVAALIARVVFVPHCLMKSLHPSWAAQSARHHTTVRIRG